VSLLGRNDPVLFPSDIGFWSPVEREVGYRIETGPATYAVVACRASLQGGFVLGCEIVAMHAHTINGVRL